MKLSGELQKTFINRFRLNAHKMFSDAVVAFNCRKLNKAFYMKSLFTILLFSFVLTSCRKNDIRPIHRITPECNYVSYNFGQLPSYDVSYGMGMKKTFNDQGLLKQLAMLVDVSVTYNEDRHDSVYYDISYHSFPIGKATITKKTKVFMHGMPQGGVEVVDAFFDFRTGYLTKIADQSLVYTSDRKKLLKFGNSTLIYDDKGNITHVPSEGGTKGAGVFYEYDHSKKAQNQFYITSGYEVSIWYNLAEAAQWIPVQPVNLRTAHHVSLGLFEENPYIFGSFLFSNHVITQDGYLSNYTVNNKESVTNDIVCTNKDE